MATATAEKNQELVPAAAATEPVVLWNKKEAKSQVSRFVKDYADLRTSLYQHYKHKGHVALGYEDSLAGFVEYCHSELKHEGDKSTVRLQLAVAEVSESVGTNIPMVIGRHLAKLPASEQREVYEEVVTARQDNGVAKYSANELEEDVRRVVRSRLGVEDKPKPVSKTNGTKPRSEVPEDAEDVEQEFDPHEEAEGDALTPTGVSRLGRAVDLLAAWKTAYELQDAEAELKAYHDTKVLLSEIG